MALYTIKFSFDFLFIYFIFDKLFMLMTLSVNETETLIQTY